VVVFLIPHNVREDLVVIEKVHEILSPQNLILEHEMGSIVNHRICGPNDIFIHLAVPVEKILGVLSHALLGVAVYPLVYRGLARYTVIPNLLARSASIRVYGL
jgi:hypothetical protein